LIVVSSPWADGAGAAAQTMEWLAAHGRTGLLQRTVVVLNDSDGHSDKRHRSALAKQFLERGQTVVEVPYDPHLRPGGVIDVRSELARRTRRTLLEITAAVAGFFASRPDTPRDTR
jgi:MinD-like ATPase involved in chromosome partitioning or flagellar assembly